MACTTTSNLPTAVWHQPGHCRLHFTTRMPMHMSMCMLIRKPIHMANAKCTGRCESGRRESGRRESGRRESGANPRRHVFPNASTYVCTHVCTCIDAQFPPQRSGRAHLQLSRPGQKPKTVAAAVLAWRRHGNCCTCRWARHPMCCHARHRARLSGTPGA